MKNFAAEGVRTTHGFFSTMQPEDLLAQLVIKLQENSQEFTVSNTHWKVNFEVKK
jgi:hypothetical protein